MSDQTTAPDKPETFETYFEYVVPEHPTVGFYEEFEAGRDEYIKKAEAEGRTALDAVANFVAVGRLVRIGMLPLQGTAAAQVRAFHDMSDVRMVPREIVTAIQVAAVWPILAKTRPLSVSMTSLKGLLGITATPNSNGSSSHENAQSPTN